ncbi:uncharacterized protein LOC129289193 [Prosopis cineraria]|uniref:uncharacterized protein LOC129289193 n=1 Tax=Prosopis cineraria TaxID=364024 RepID=UPI0024105166|nr:uncharacterized protein LOC129289193 [Prosopis cineraria]
MKQHLAGVSGQVASCKKVPHDVHHRMVESLKVPERSANKRQASTALVENYFALRTTPGSQPSIMSVLATKEAQYNAKMTIAEWAIIGKKECQLLIESHRAKWKNTGCTLMADGWTDVRQRTLINFLVYSTYGMVFVKSVDASNLVKDARTLFSLFCEVIEWVGPKNIIHMVTNNAANYVACGKLIKEKYKNIYWSPCAAHCLNLTLKDIASLDNVSALANKASKITIFIYNHMIFLSWLRKRLGWKEIVCPGATRFATTFITLHSIYMHKHDLQALVTDKHFVDHKLSKTQARIIVTTIILDNGFWGDCLEIVKVVSPLIKLLRIVNLDEKPSLPSVYEGMQRAKKAIKATFNNKKDYYKPYKNIIQARWDKHFKTNLHAAAYLLNPAFLYDENFIHKRRLMDAMLDVFESNESEEIDYIVMMKQLSLYRDHKSLLTKLHMNGGHFMEVLFQNCKLLQYAFLAKLLLLLAVKEIGVCLNASIPKDEIDYNIKD